MRTGWGTLACGVVVGAAAGFVCGHVAAWTQASARADENPSIPAWPEPADQFVLPSLADDNTDPNSPVFFPEHLHGSLALAEPVHADAELSGSEPVRSTEPAALPEPAEATLLAADGQETLRALLDAELSHLSAADREVWLDVLEGLPPADAVGIVRLWKRFGSGPAVDDSDHPLPDLFNPSALAPTPVPEPKPGVLAATPSKLHEARAIVQHNLHNAATIGFHRIEPVFSSPPPNSDSTARPPVMIASRIDHTAGTLIETASPLDLAIDGEGFFVVKHPTGGTLYTRCGRFSRDPDGRLSLTTSHGDLPIEPEIRIPGDSTGLLVAFNGEVSIQRDAAEREQIGVLRLAMFVAPAQLNATDDALFMPSARSGAPQVGQPGDGVRGNLLQRHLEPSNVDAARETALLRQIDDWVRTANEAWEPR